MSKRVERLKQSVVEQKAQKVAAGSGEERLRHGACAALTDAELEHLIAYLERRKVDQGAQLSAEEQAALEAYQCHHREFKVAGKLMTVRGFPVDYTGKWPEANGCSVGMYLECVVVGRGHWLLSGCVAAENS